MEEASFLGGALLKAIDSILQRSKTPPIIALISDHGYAFGKENDDFMRSRHSNLAAFLVPSKVKELFYPSVTAVNVFRLLFKGMFAADLSPLPDRTIYSVAGRHDFREFE